MTKQQLKLHYQTPTIIYLSAVSCRRVAFNQSAYSLIRQFV